MRAMIGNTLVVFGGRGIWRGIIKMITFQSGERGGSGGRGGNKLEGVGKAGKDKEGWVVGEDPGELSVEDCTDGGVLITLNEWNE